VTEGVVLLSLSITLIFVPTHIFFVKTWLSIWLSNKWMFK